MMTFEQFCGALASNSLPSLDNMHDQVVIAAGLAESFAAISGASAPVSAEQLEVNALRMQMAHCKAAAERHPDLRKIATARCAQLFDAIEAHPWTKAERIKNEEYRQRLMAGTAKLGRFE